MNRLRVKPFYIAGPHDDQEAIMQKLREKLGEGGFEFMLPLHVEGL